MINKRKIADFFNSHRQYQYIELHAYTYLWEDEQIEFVEDMTPEEILDRARELRRYQKTYWHEHKSELEGHDLPIPAPCVYLAAYDENKDFKDGDEIIIYKA